MQNMSRLLHGIGGRAEFICFLEVPQKRGAATRRGAAEDPQASLCPVFWILFQYVTGKEIQKLAQSDSEKKE